MASVTVSRLTKLAGIGIVAGTFSALFGVGGGAIMVPLLIWLGYGERSATGTSLAAICIIALFAAVNHGLYGNVHLDKAALVGLPAVGGVLFGTWLQQRVPTRAISLLLALLLVVVGVKLVVG